MWSWVCFAFTLYQAADGGKEFVKFVKFVRGYSIKWVGNFLGLLRQDRASRPYVFFRLSEAHRFNCFGAVRDKILIAAMNDSDSLCRDPFGRPCELPDWPGLK